MEHRHEVITFPENSPIKIFIHRIGDVNLHWHQSIELLYIVKGTVKINVGGKEGVFPDDGLILINSNVPHSLYSDGATMIAAQLRLDRLPMLPSEIKNSYFECIDDLGETNREKFVPIKQCLASLLKLNVEGGTQINLMNISLCYKLLYELYANFAAPEHREAAETDEQLKRLNVLLGYINANYTDDLSLDTLSSVVNITVPYLSKSFKQYMGMTVGDYIKNIRLYHSATLLRSTKDGMDLICSKCGFPNTHSFITAFKDKYGMLPSKWRKSAGAQITTLQNPENAKIGYQVTGTEILYSTVSDFIIRYADRTMSLNTQSKPIKANSEVTVGKGKGVKLRRSERGIIGVSRAKELLFAPIREQLAEAQREIGFKYVKMHSIFDDDMMVYSEYDGKPHYNFSLVDKVYDFLMSIHIKPYVQLSFMPSALARDANKTTFYAKTITSPPKDIEKWNELVRKFVNHLTDRYGRAEVESWPFAVWNEPWTSTTLFGFADKKDYLELFTNSFRTIKGINENIKVGGPSHFAAYGKGNMLLTEFLNDCRQNDCIPDFIDLHYYDTDMSRTYIDKNGIRLSSRLSPRPHTYFESINGIKQSFIGTRFENIPIYLSEWNSTTSHRDLLSDTCFKSSYIVQNTIETLDMLEEAGYWLLSDLHEESLLNNKLFHGGLGLFTTNGIKKPAYFAYYFLSRLKDNLLEKGENYIITEENGNYALLLVNYSHYSKAYSEEIGINTSYGERYSVFPESGTKDFAFSFPLASGNYNVLHEYVNRNYGSAFDNFIKMGGNEPLSERETERLKNITYPRMKKEVVTAPFTLRITLQPFEIRLIEITPVCSEND